MLFEDEGKFSVMAKDQIREEHYAYGQTVNVLWGKGRMAQCYKAKLMLCGMPFHSIDSLLLTIIRGILLHS